MTKPVFAACLALLTDISEGEVRGLRASRVDSREVSHDERPNYVSADPEEQLESLLKLENKLALSGPSFVDWGDESERSLEALRFFDVS